MYIRGKFLFIGDAFDSVYNDLYDIVLYYVMQYTNVKIKLTFFLHLKENKSQQVLDRYFNAPYFMVTHQNYIHSILEFQLNYILGTLNLFSHEKSGYTLLYTKRVLCSFSAAKTTSVGQYIALPKSLRYRHGLLNPKTRKGESCFLICVLASLFGHMISLKKFPNRGLLDLPAKSRGQLKKKLANPIIYNKEQVA